MFDLMLVDRTKSLGREAISYRLDTALDDAFSRILRPVWLEGKISITSVFASRMVLDILNICKDGQKFHADMLAMHSYAYSSFGFSQQNDTVQIDEFKWLHEATALIEDSYNILDKIKTHPISKLKMAKLEADRMFPQFSNPPGSGQRLGAEQFDFLKPSQDLDFSVTHSPVLCSSATLKLALKYHTAGISLANQHLSIFFCAHL